jgi:HK97 family phage major capsid protein
MGYTANTVHLPGSHPVGRTPGDRLLPDRPRMAAAPGTTAVDATPSGPDPGAVCAPWHHLPGCLFAVPGVSPTRAPTHKGFTMSVTNPQLEAVIAEMRSIADALPPGSVLTDAQQARWDALETEAARLKKWQADVERGTGYPTLGSSEAAVRGYSTAMRAVEANPYATDAVKQLVVESIEDPAPGTDVDALTRWAAAAADADYLTAFAKMVADPMTSHARMTTAEINAVQRASAEARAMSLSDSAGGYMIPLSLDPAVLVANAGVNDPMRTIARRVAITTDAWHGVRSEGITASWDAEAVEVSDDSPTLAQPVVKAHKLAAFVPFSMEVGMDAANFQAEMQRLLLDAFDVSEGHAFWTGTGDGSNQPTGIITALDANTNVEVSITTSGSFSLTDVYKLHEALPARFRRNATWAANITTINRLRRFGEGTTGSQSAYWADLGAGQPPLLLGHPIVEASAMAPATTGTGAANLLVIGDFRQYLIVDRVGSTIELVPHLFGTTNNRPTGQRGLFATKRVGGGSLVDNAFRLLTNT